MALALGVLHLEGCLVVAQQGLDFLRQPLDRARCFPHVSSCFSCILRGQIPDGFEDGQSSDDSRRQLMHLFKQMPGFGGDTATQQFSGGTVGSDGVRCICKDPLVMSGVPASMALMALNLAIRS